MLYAFLRLLDLDRMVTTDEPLWLGRSANFYRALRTGEYSATYQQAHPGVPTMWLGAIAWAVRVPDIARILPANLDEVRNIDLVLRDAGIDPMRLLVTARVVKVLGQTALFVAALAGLHRLLNWGPFVVAGTLIATDPFASALDSLLHIDGLQAISLVAAVTWLAVAFNSQDRDVSWWIGSGVFAAIAWMTRSTGIVIAALPLMWLMIQIVRWWRGNAEAAPALMRFGLWMSVAAVTSVALLPAMWVYPVGTALKLIGYTVHSAATGHEAPQFFRGVIVDGDPGLLFYPLTLVWRLSPIVIVGLAASVLVLIRQRREIDRLRPHLWIGAFGVLYLAVMTLSAKKFDRYILPIYPLLAIGAAIGLVWLLRRIVGERWAVVTGVALAVLVNCSLVAQTIPYRLGAYEPLLGGAAAAQEEFQTGWGQGGDEAMAIISRDADGRDVIVYTADFVTAYRYFAPQNIELRRLEAGAPIPTDADYVISSIQQSQRNLDADLSSLPAEPRFSIAHNGVTLMRIWRIDQSSD